MRPAHIIRPITAFLQMSNKFGAVHEFAASWTGDSRLHTRATSVILHIIMRVGRPAQWTCLSSIFAGVVFVDRENVVGHRFTTPPFASDLERLQAKWD